MSNDTDDADSEDSGVGSMGPADTDDDGQMDGGFKGDLGDTSGYRDPDTEDDMSGVDPGGAGDTFSQYYNPSFSLTMPSTNVSLDVDLGMFNDMARGVDLGTSPSFDYSNPTVNAIGKFIAKFTFATVFDMFTTPATG